MRTNTPPQTITRPDGSTSTRITAKRVCNGCGHEIGDVTILEIECSWPRQVCDA